MAVSISTIARMSRAEVEHFLDYWWRRKRAIYLKAHALAGGEGKEMLEYLYSEDPHLFWDWYHRTTG